MKRPKITIVGAGNVGATAAHWAAAKRLGDLVMVDLQEGLPQGKALDLLEAGPVEGYDLTIVGANDYEASADSNLVIIAAGHPRKPGLARDQLLKSSVKMVAEVTARAVEKSPEAILIVVSAPVEAMTYVAHQVSGLPAQRVIGQAGVLDAARLRTFVAAELGCSVEDVQAILLGSHGDDLVVLPRYTSVAGIPITQLIAPGKLEEIITRTRNGGAEIVNLLKSGSAYYAPAAATIAMAESIVRNRRRVLPCVAYCDQEYGAGGQFVGVPCVLGRDGVEKVIEVKLEPHEREAFQASLEHTRQLCETARKFLPS